jgi:hypothetical protein
MALDINGTARLSRSLHIPLTTLAAEPGAVYGVPLSPACERAARRAGHHCNAREAALVRTGERCRVCLNAAAADQFGAAGLMR